MLPRLLMREEGGFLRGTLGENGASLTSGQWLGGKLVSTDYNESTHVVSLTALTRLMAERGSTATAYANRIRHLNATLAGGLNGGYRLTGLTVHNDAAVDRLFGNGGWIGSWPTPATRYSTSKAALLRPRPPCSRAGSP
jgi:hypothetical protein